MIKMDITLNMWADGLARRDLIGIEDTLVDALSRLNPWGRIIPTFSLT